ncbi:MAG TPA: GNAT family N-acetyltransferase [Chiayiivirga sp.]|nr:GNAT family N-acetyltransferase [Chiayiivirga sp.]
MTPAVTVREAAGGDAGALAELAEATFRATFAATNAAVHMDAHCRASYGEAIQAAEIADPGRITLLCERAGALIGYAQLRSAPVPGAIATARAGEIQRFYLAAAAHGKGVAPALMAACLDALRRRGCDTAWLGVWEHNPRALAFYRKIGFAVVGEHVFLLGDDPQRDLVMTMPLALRG